MMTSNNDDIKLSDFIKDYLPKFNNLQQQQETYVLDYDPFDNTKYKFSINTFQNTKLQSKKCYNLLMPINTTIDIAFNSSNNSYSLQIRNRDKLPYDYIAYYWRNKVYTNYEDYCFYVKEEDLDPSKENILLALLNKKDENNNNNLLPTIMMNGKRMLQVEISILDGKVYPVFTNYTDKPKNFFKNLYDVINYYQIIYFEKDFIYFDKNIYVDLVTFINNYDNVEQYLLEVENFYEDLQIPYFYSFSYNKLNNPYKFIISTFIGYRFNIEKKEKTLVWRDLLNYVPLYQRNLFKIDNSNNFTLKNINDNTKSYCVDIVNCVVLQINASEKAKYEKDLFLIFNTDQLMSETDFKKVLKEEEDDKFLNFPVKNSQQFDKSKIDARKLQYKNDIFQPLIQNYLNLKNNQNTVNKSNVEENSDVDILKITNFNEQILKSYVIYKTNILINKINDDDLKNNFYKFINDSKEMITTKILQKNENLILLNYDKKNYILNGFLQVCNFMSFFKIYTNVDLLIKYLDKESENYKRIKNNIEEILLKNVPKNKENDIIIKVYNKLIDEITFINNEIITPIHDYINNYNFGENSKNLEPQEEIEEPKIKIIDNYDATTKTYSFEDIVDVFYNLKDKDKISENDFDKLKQQYKQMNDSLDIINDETKNISVPPNRKLDNFITLFKKNYNSLLKLNYNDYKNNIFTNMNMNYEVILKNVNKK